MSFKIRAKNFGKNDRSCKKVAIIKGGEQDKKCLFLCDDESGDIEMTLKGRSSFQPVPILEDNQIERLYISGASGSGKSFYLSKWLKEFVKLKGNKDVPIYLFSTVEYDEALDDPFEDQLIRVLDEIDEEEFVNDPPSLDDYEEGSVLVFDDIMKVSNARLRITLLSILNSLQEIARHKKLTLITTSHIISDYHATRTVLNEATAITVFPRYAGGLAGVRDYLKRKIGMSPHEIKKFLGLSKNSRWVSLYKRTNMFVISQKTVYIYDPFSDV